MLIKRLTKDLRRRTWQYWNPDKPWHMRPYDARFAIERSPDETRIFWSGRHVASCLSASRIQRLNDVAAIVASGPTLLETPATAWLSADVVCVNGSIVWAHERGIRPLLYVVTDGGFARRRLDVIRLAIELSGTVCLSIRCDDLAKVADTLRRRGVGVEGEVVERRGAFGTGPSLYVLDPDGYMIELKPR